jgi:hypothetical protein
VRCRTPLTAAAGINFAPAYGREARVSRLYMLARDGKIIADDDV